MKKLTLTPDDRAYAQEFRDSPYGPHSPRLDRIVGAFRGGPAKGRYVLVATKPHREWMLGRMTGKHSAPLEVFEECRFTSLREAEWEVFKLRWREVAGEALAGETLLNPGPLSPARPAISLTAYSDKISVRPGETIRFMVNSEKEADYDAELVRVVCGDINPDGPGYKEEPVKSTIEGRYTGRRQVIRAGSCVLVPDSPALRGLDSLSVTAMVWPASPGNGRAESLVARFSDESKLGFALMLDGQGAVALRLGDGAAVETVTTGSPLRAREWAWVGATFDAKSGHAVVFHESQQHYPPLETERWVEKDVAASIGRTGVPLTIAAHVSAGEGGTVLTTGHANARIDSPRLAAAALSREALKSLQHDALAEPSLVAAWDFSRGITTTRINDVGPNALHGRTHNLPARGMKGWNWSGREMSWKHAPDEYGAIQFHDDDVYDAGWTPDFELDVPELRSGVYAARLKCGTEEEYVPFYVRPARGTASANILFLAPTASYMAYGNILGGLGGAGAERVLGRLLALQPQDVFLATHREYGRSVYDLHPDGSGITHFSRLQPNLTMRPKSMRSDGGGDGSALRQFNADTHLLDWLEAKGHAYDVATDEDLHAEGVDCLKPYRVVITGSHPEYYSSAMWDAVKAYTNAGGRLMYMGGNGFYWHIAFHEELPGVIEVRKADGVRDWESEPGERNHGFTGEPSGLFRSAGRAPQRLVGVGMAAMGLDRGAPYRRLAPSFDPRAAFIFEGVAEDEPIGDFGLTGGGAAGLEVDRAEPALGTPPHALIVASSVGQHTDMYRVSIEELLLNGFETSGTTNDMVRADLVYFETPAGGAVFSTGSIAWCGALSHNSYDNAVSRITHNVLSRFAAAE